METGLFEIQAEHLRDYRANSQSAPAFSRRNPCSIWASRLGATMTHQLSKITAIRCSPAEPNLMALLSSSARCFLRLANLPNFALDRLSRYETTLWRQA